MLKRPAILLLSLLLLPAVAGAYDFAATVPSGQVLYFSIVQEGVEVVYPQGDSLPTRGVWWLQMGDGPAKKIIANDWP